MGRDVCPTHPHPARLSRPSQGAATGDFWLGWEGWRRSWGTVQGINLLPKPLWGLQPSLHQLPGRIPPTLVPGRAARPGAHFFCPLGPRHHGHHEGTMHPGLGCRWEGTWQDQSTQILRVLKWFFSDSYPSLLILLPFASNLIDEYILFPDSMRFCCRAKFCAVCVAMQRVCPGTACAFCWVFKVTPAHVCQIPEE